MEEYIDNNGSLSDVEDYDEFDKDEETHGNENHQHVDDENLNRRDQQHATASDNIITDDHQNEQAPTTPLEDINQHDQQTSTLLTDQFNDNNPLHEAAVVQENIIALEMTDQPTTDEFTIPPVDTTKVYRRRNEAEKDSIDKCYIPSTTDWFEDWNPSDGISELNIVMGIGSQTQKLIDYCSTPLQRTGVSYDDGTREGSNKNKKVLLKNMDNNINKYIALVTKMNNIVTDAKEKCYWDPDIMRMCKRWDDAVKNTVSTTDQVTSGGDEALVNKVGDGGDNIQELRGDKDATVQKENTGKTKARQEFV
ncbi:hypothetical protein HanPI659440_Chr07g0259441 [Helianthus annuus]|nr:hypothetical protein HanPI659440_Chr07g0259441 [Helianthus annuus]